VRFVCIFVASLLSLQSVSVLQSTVRFAATALQCVCVLVCVCVRLCVCVCVSVCVVCVLTDVLILHANVHTHSDYDTQTTKSRAIATSSLIIGLARTIYIRCVYGIFGREITKYTTIYGVFIRFWPTLTM
jgi:hypothetical protein